MGSRSKLLLDAIVFFKLWPVFCSWRHIGLYIWSSVSLGIANLTGLRQHYKWRSPQALLNCECVGLDSQKYKMRASLETNENRWVHKWFLFEWHSIIMRFCTIYYWSVCTIHFIVALQKKMFFQIVFLASRDSCLSDIGQSFCDDLTPFHLINSTALQYLIVKNRLRRVRTTGKLLTIGSGLLPWSQQSLEIHKKY